MEQNWSWNGGAAYERTIPYSGDCYVFYSLRCASGKAKMNVPEADTVSPWAKSAVQRADALGVTSGLVGGYRRTITRGVLVRLCVNTAELNGFKVDQTNPYGAACALGVMNTDETGEFAPWASVTRADAAITLTRLLALVGEVPAARQSVLFALSDAAEIPSAARSSVAAMLASGLMSAESGCFRPNDPITTEQVLSVLVQILDDPARSTSAPPGATPPQTRGSRWPSRLSMPVIFRRSIPMERLFSEKKMFFRGSLLFRFTFRREFAIIVSTLKRYAPVAQLDRVTDSDVSAPFG